MSEQSHRPLGLLTERERETIVADDVQSGERNAIREYVRDRLQATLEDVTLLYPTLRDTDIEAVFCPEDDGELSTIRTATQNALGLLVLGMLVNDDLLETRLSDAIRYAGLANDEEVSVDLEIRRGPLPTLEQCQARFEDEGLTEETLTLYEQFTWNADTDPERVAAAGQRLGMEATIAEVRDVRDASDAFSRLPQTVITNVDVESIEPEEAP